MVSRDILSAGQLITEQNGARLLYWILGWKTFTFYIIDFFLWVLLLLKMIMIWACFVFSCPLSQTVPPREKADEGRKWSLGRCSPVLTRGMVPLRGAPEYPKFGWRNMLTTPLPAFVDFFNGLIHMFSLRLDGICKSCDISNTPLKIECFHHLIGCAWKLDC